MANDDDMVLDGDVEEVTTKDENELDMNALEDDMPATIASDDDLTGAALLTEDAEAIREENDDAKAPGLGGKHDDIGIASDNWEVAEIRSGVEDNEDEEDLGALGFHEERFTDAIDGGSKDDDV